jgi:hydrogenase expression/formation protein HypC
MCVAFPGKIVEIYDNNIAIIEISGVKRKINLGLLGDEVKIGDYVIAHAGFAIHIVDKKEAEESLKLLDDLLKEANNIESC